MKWTIGAITLAMALMVSGCSHYVMTTKDGRVLMAQGKPKTDEKTGLIEYTDSDGKKVQINGDEISSIIKR